MLEVVTGKARWAARRNVEVASIDAPEPPLVINHDDLYTASSYSCWCTASLSFLLYTQSPGLA